jgi:hypothetical protein
MDGYSSAPTETADRFEFPHGCAGTRKQERCAKAHVNVEWRIDEATDDLEVMSTAATGRQRTDATSLTPIPQESFTSAGRWECGAADAAVDQFWAWALIRGIRSILSRTA